MKIVNYSLVAALAAGVLLAAGNQAGAQENKTEKKHFTAGAARPGDRMAEDLKLTDEQKAKMKTFREEQRKQAEEIRNGTNFTPEQKREKAKAMREDADKKMKEILTPEQYAKWEKARAQWKKGPPASPGGQGQQKAKTE